jgi:hypothetical protein
LLSVSQSVSQSVKVSVLCSLFTREVHLDARLLSRSTSVSARVASLDDDVRDAKSGSRPRLGSGDPHRRIAWAPLSGRESRAVKATLSALRRSIAAEENRVSRWMSWFHSQLEHIGAVVYSDAFAGSLWKLPAWLLRHLSVTALDVVLRALRGTLRQTSASASSSSSSSLLHTNTAAGKWLTFKNGQWICPRCVGACGVEN